MEYTQYFSNIFQVYLELKQHLLQGSCQSALLFIRCRYHPLPPPVSQPVARGLITFSISKTEAYCNGADCSQLIDSDQTQSQKVQLIRHPISHRRNTNSLPLQLAITQSFHLPAFCFRAQPRLSGSLTNWTGLTPNNPFPTPSSANCAYRHSRSTACAGIQRISNKYLYSFMHIIPN